LRDLRHGHREALDDHMGVEGLEDISRDETVVDAGVLVLLQLGQLALPDVHHGWRVSGPQRLRDQKVQREVVVSGDVV
jgi:hypothetical protein